MSMKRINDLLNGSETPTNDELLTVVQYLYTEIQRLEAKVENKDDIDHEHNEYADSDHTHNEYADSDHSHSVNLE